MPGFVVGGRYDFAHQAEDHCRGGGSVDGDGLGRAGPRLKGDGRRFARAEALSDALDPIGQRL